MSVEKLGESEDDPVVRGFSGLSGSTASIESFEYRSDSSASYGSTSSTSMGKNRLFGNRVGRGRARGSRRLGVGRGIASTSQDSSVFDRGANSNSTNNLSDVYRDGNFDDASSANSADIMAKSSTPSPPVPTPPANSADVIPASSTPSPPVPTPPANPGSPLNTKPAPSKRFKGLENVIDVYEGVFCILRFENKKKFPFSFLFSILFCFLF